MKEKVWIWDKEKVGKEVIAGEHFESVGTAFGENDLWISLLKETGLWDQVASLRPKVKGNGVPWERLNGILVLKELLALGKLQHVGKLIRDGGLMHQLGFNLEVIKEKLEEDKGIIHRDTARNHLKRMEVEESVSHFYGFVRWMREKRWVRGNICAADGFVIEVTGKTYPGVGKVWDDKEKRWKWGYKVVILMNITSQRERIIGYALGPIEQDERTLLRTILNDLEKRVASVHEIIDTLVLDRGYFGWDFFEELTNRWKVQFILMAKKNLLLSEEVAHLTGSGQVTLAKRFLDGAAVEVGAVHGVMHGYKNKSQPYLGKLNVAILRQKEEEKTKEYYYVTNRPIRNPLKLIELYRRRWTIENQGIRTLSQQWKIRDLPGRTLNAIQARLTLVLELYNAVHIIEMKYPKDTESLQNQLKKRGERSFLYGDGIIIYCQDQLATFTEAQFQQLIEKRTRRETAQAIQSVLKKPKHLREQALERLSEKLLE